MKTKLVLCLAAMLAVGSASAETINAGDGGGTNFGDTQGFAIDFDSSVATNADWVPDLVAGTSYNLNSVSIIYGGAQDPVNVAPKYLGIYTGLSGGVLSGFLGTSTNSIDFAALAAGSPATFNFSGKQVTADSTAGSGSGLLHFIYQDGTAALAGPPGYDVSTRRFENSITDPNLAFTNTLSNIIAFGGLNNNRAPEYSANLSVVPEPAAIVLLGLYGVALFGARRFR